MKKGTKVFIIMLGVIILLAIMYIVDNYNIFDKNIVANSNNTNTTVATNSSNTTTNSNNTNTAANTTVANEINTTTNSSSEINTITQEEAEKILEEKYGIEDEETGNLISYGYMGIVQDKDSNKYYAFRQSWLVDNSHMSFLENLFVSLDGKTIKTSSNPAGYEENEVVEFD